MNLFIGCSGYYYPAWKDIFYPSWLPTSQWLEYYSQNFLTIEINSTFYKFPTTDSLQRRYKKTPEDFVFSIKAPKVLTHDKKMYNVQEELHTLYETIETWLKEKAKCLLFQFSASFTYTNSLLERVLDVDSKRILHIYEFRHKSRRNSDVYQALEKKWIIFCNVSHPDLDDMYITTPGSIYLRLHGKSELFKSSYGKEWLTYWIDNLKKEKGNGKDNIYVYFNNTWYGEAIQDAKRLLDLLKP